jgi:hypothetical protein
MPIQNLRQVLGHIVEIRDAWGSPAFDAEAALNAMKAIEDYLYERPDLRLDGCACSICKEHR